MSGDGCRFCRIYAYALLAFSAVVGALFVVQAGLGLSRFGGTEYLMRTVALSSVRSLAPAVAGSALLLAFVVWAHPLPASRVEVELRRYLARGALVSLPGYLLAACVLAGVGACVARLLFGASWASASAGLGLLAARDWLTGGLATLVDAVPILFLAWRFLARLQAGRSSLAMKLVLAWTFATGLRLAVGVVESLVLPG